MLPVSVQLYSLRTESERDFDGVLTALAGAGYQGVEPFNLFGMTPAAFRNRVEALGMQVSSSHYPFANRAPVSQTAEILGELGLKRALGGYAPADFQDLITRVPGVGATGQNGIFETFSIRGSGGNGILILVGGMPVTAQRRAGVPASFVEPSLLGEINVTRGPAAVHFGPGALGGAIAIEPRWFDGGAASAGYAHSGDEITLMGGFGGESFSVAAARHAAADSQAANGTPLNTSFERDSASLQYRTQLGDYALDALLLPSRTQDIGKSNSRYPARDTTYPKDEHTLARLRLRHDSGFEARVHGHDQSLLTFNQRPGAPDTSSNRRIKAR